MAELTIDHAKIKDDLYHAVNDEWLKTAQIPADKPATGGFYDLADNIEKTLMHDFSAYLTSDQPIAAELQEFAAFYRLASDFTSRDAAGFTPAKPYLAQFEQLSDLVDWQAKLPKFLKQGVVTPFSLRVEPDMKNTKNNVAYFDVASLILPDKTYYEDDNQNAQALLDVYAQMAQTLMHQAGYDEAFAKNCIDKALKFDASLAPFERNSTERADYTKLYNKYAIADFVKLSNHTNFEQILAAVFGSVPEFVIVTEPNYFKNFDKLVNETTFDNLKAWILVKEIVGAAGLLSDEARRVGGQFGRALSGTKQAMDAQKAAYYLATQTFSQAVGRYYALKYFGAKAKADVTTMVNEMITVYKHRLAHNDWLSPKTAKKAITKLDHLAIKVGYPDKLPEVYAKLHVDEHKSLFENALAFNQIFIEDNFKRLNSPVDRTRWLMPAHMVNAYYDPNQNVIVFPAAVLQAPFYSLKQSSSQNFGGIGAVIAHEISHAFDNNGAKFDEYGNLNNWWNDDDLNHFEQLAQAVIAQFDGLTTPAGKVNGKLVVSENIADAGGLSCASAAAKRHQDCDLSAFFINWAKIWCMKSSLQRQQLLLKIDVHAPNILRANVQPQNIDDFYQTFNIKEGDGMYLPKEKRIAIW